MLTAPPELITFVEAEYPARALEAGLTASVVLRVVIDATGAVDEATVDQPATPAGYGFDEAATDAVMAFAFKPAEVDHQPAAVEITYRYVFTLKAEPKAAPRGSLAGVLLERGTRTPLVGVVVRLPGLAEQLTDASGRFRLDELPVGPHAVEIDDDAYYTIIDREVVREGEVTEVTWYVERRAGADDSVLVVGRRPKKDVVRRTLVMQEITKIPGTQGDALKVVQALPGVARVPFGGGALVVRGSNPGDSIATIERHYIPLAFHFGGLRSVFPSELLESIDFRPGNFGAEFGRYTGGIVDVRLKRPRSDGLHGRIEADVFDAGVFLEGPLTEHATFALAGRRSYFDAILPAVMPDDSTVNLSVAPRYWDLQAVYDWKHRGHRVRAFMLSSDDRVDLALAEPADTDPNLRGGIENHTAFYRGYLSWDVRITPETSHHVSASVGRNNILVAVGPNLFAESKGDYFVLRDELKHRLTDALTLRGGLDLEAWVGDVRIRAPILPKEGGSRIPSAVRDIVTIEETLWAALPAAWLEARWQIRRDLLLVPGLRVDHAVHLADTSVDPRLTVRWRAGEDTTLKGGVGQHSQRPSPDESNKTLGNPAVDFEHSLQVSGGFEHRFSEALDLDVVGFYKHIYDAIGPVAGPDHFRNDGEGRIYGLEMMLRHALRERFFGWISYTLMRSERRDPGETDYRLFTLDQTHILTVVAQYKLSNTWEVGLRWRYVTGNPHTPIVGADYDADADVWVPQAGVTASERMPAFAQLDVRVDRNWIYETWTLTAYLDLQNALNRANPEGYVYDFDYSDRSLVTGLPIVPSIGLRGAF